MQTIGRYAIEVTTQRPFDDAIARVTELLAEEGFGVLTEIDVRSTLKKKLDVDVKPYRILGACNPHFAHRALQVEPHVGVLMPCNVVIWEADTHRVVAAMEPRVLAQVIDRPELEAVAAEMSVKLRRVLERLG